MGSWRPPSSRAARAGLAVFVDGVNLDTAERLATDLGVTGDPRVSCPGSSTRP